ncbi:MAG: peptidoglycan-binding protein [Nitrospira sp.]
MEVTITRAVGDTRAEKGTNVAIDVQKVQELLNKVQIKPYVQPNGKCDGQTIEAIKNFQRLWTDATIDGRVDPSGRTLRRLNLTTKPLKLKPISLGKIDRGGYIISYEGEVPPPPVYKVLLCVSNPLYTNDVPGKILTGENRKHCIDISGRNKSDVIGPDNLPAFLQQMEVPPLWGGKAHCRLYVLRQDDTIVSCSNIELLDCPVRPLKCELTPELGRGDDGPSLAYTGIQTGRMLHHVPINKGYFFKYAGKFETTNDMRGLNCITYVGAVYGVDSSTGAMGSYGTQLAEVIGATKCDMENKKEADIKAFFSGHTKETYIMWSSSHVVLVVSGVVYEFSESKGGFVVTPVDDWNFHGKQYWIRKSPKDL